MTPLSGNGVMNNIVTLLMHFSGILIAVRVVTDRFKRDFLDDLHRAHSAVALCMTMPQVPNTARSAQRGLSVNSNVSSALIPSASQHVDSLVTNIHGQWQHPLRLANNLSALKTVAGII